MGAILFAPSAEDAVAIRMDDQDSMLGKKKSGSQDRQRAQANEGMGEGGYNMPCIAVGGRDGAEASVVLATDLTGRPFATRTPTDGAIRLRLPTGALDAK